MNTWANVPAAWRGLFAKQIQIFDLQFILMAPGVLLDLLFMLRTLWKITPMDILFKRICPLGLKKLAVEIFKYVWVISPLECKEAIHFDSKYNQLTIGSYVSMRSSR